MIRWFTPRAGQFASKSADGYYAVGHEDPRSLSHCAYHIEAAFALPKEIGIGDTLADAQRVCQEHFERLHPAA